MKQTKHWLKEYDRGAPPQALKAAWGKYLTALLIEIGVEIASKPSDYAPARENEAPVALPLLEGRRRGPGETGARTCRASKTPDCQPIERLVCRPKKIGF